MPDKVLKRFPALQQATEIFNQDAKKAYKMKRNFTIDELADEQSGSFSASIYEHTATTIMTAEEELNKLSSRKQAEDLVKNDS